MPEPEQLAAVELERDKWDVVLEALGQESDEIRGPSFTSPPGHAEEEANQLDQIADEIFNQVF